MAGIECCGWEGLLHECILKSRWPVIEAAESRLRWHFHRRNSGKHVILTLGNNVVWEACKIEMGFQALHKCGILSLCHGHHKRR